MTKSDPDQPPTAPGTFDAGAFDPVDVVANLPHLPGVYRMLNAAGDVLYVGKAPHLKKRVASFFQKTASLAPRIQLMILQVPGLETTGARVGNQDLLLENNPQK